MIYVFQSPLSKEQTIGVVREVVSAIGGTYKNDIGTWRAKGFATVLSSASQFFYHEKENVCNVRVVFRRHSNDSRRFWKTFVDKLNQLHPDINFGISGNTPYELVAVVDLQNDVETVHLSKTHGGASIGGFLLGGLAFGTPGAIVGGLSGTQRTVGSTRTVRSDRVNVRILWSDGLLHEQWVNKKESLYHEIMNMMS